MQAGQSVAQNVTITGLPRKFFRVIFFPVMVVNVTSGALVEARFIVSIEMNTSAIDREANKMNRDAINRDLIVGEGNCSGIYVNVLLAIPGL